MTFIYCLCFFSNLTFGGVWKKAVIRDEDFDAKIKSVELVDLIKIDRFEGKYFKIVKGKSSEAISFEDSHELQLKAATTYYHLSKARKYFVDVVKSEYVKNLPQLTIRLDITNGFNEVGHFDHDKLNPMFNNAVSIPPGDGYAPAKVPGWDYEIWFRPQKEINIKDFNGPIDQAPSMKHTLSSFRSATHLNNFELVLISVIQKTLNFQDPKIFSTMFRLVGSSVFVEAIYQSTDVAAEFFQRRIYRLESALVPEIIYHEFSHIALSDHLELSHSSPVNEGLADFFAGKISQSKKLALNIDKYNLYSGKEVKNKAMYRQDFEMNSFANNDFVFGLLWNLGETVGSDIEGKFVYELSKKLSSNSSIKEDLVGEALQTCELFCQTPLVDKYKLYKMFHFKGI